MSGLAIREARAEDAAALAGLIGQLGYSITDGDVAARMEGLAGPGRRVLVGEIEGRAVGCLTTSMMHVLHRPAPVGRISMMVVDEAHRSGGIGARLVREAERLLEADGCYMVEVTSNLARPRAHAFYENLGYEKTSARFAVTLADRIR